MLTHIHYPGCGHDTGAIPDYNNFPSQFSDPRLAYAGDPATPDQPHAQEIAVSVGGYAPFVAMQAESADRYPGLPEYVTWDVYTPLVMTRNGLPGPGSK